MIKTDQRLLAAAAAVIGTAAVAGLALSTLKSADGILGFTARHPLSPATWIVIGIAAAMTFALTKRTAARWIVPLASGAAFLAVAQSAGDDGIPRVSPHESLQQ
jgi:hypothetical protein